MTRGWSAGFRLLRADAAEGLVSGASVDAVRVCGGVGEDSDGGDKGGELVELPELLALVVDAAQGAVV